MSDSMAASSSSVNASRRREPVPSLGVSSSISSSSSGSARLPSSMSLPVPMPVDNATPMGAATRSPSPDDPHGSTTRLLIRDYPSSHSHSRSLRSHGRTLGRGRSLGGASSGVGGVAGGGGVGAGASGNGGGGGPSDEAQAVRINVLNSSVAEAREVRNSRLIMILVTVVNLPQIVAACIVMGLKWKVGTFCYRIQIWVLLHTLYLTASLVLEWLSYCLNGNNMSNRAIHLREAYMNCINNIKYAVDMGGTFWFLVGNVWVISYGDRCDDGSAMYELALWLIIIAYIKLFLPCILLLALLPIICFCLPCLIRLLSRLQDPMRGKGATQESINRLKTKIFTRTMFDNPDDANCCICLNDYELNQELRVLPCQHHFHQECVDEWLLVNSTCPTCRTSIYDSASSSPNGDQTTHPDQTHANDPVMIV